MTQTPRLPAEPSASAGVPTAPDTDSRDRRLLSLVAPESRRVGLATLLQVATVGTGIGLMATSAWLISTAALHPSIAVLGVAIVGVRFFGLSRGIFRYLERLASHDVTLRLLSRLRARVFRALVPLAPARLLGHRGGDLLGRMVEDVGTLENLYVRVLGPSLAAAVLVILVGAGLVAFGAPLAALAVAGLLAGGVVAPALAVRLADAPGQRAVARRGELAAGAADGVQGCADLVAFGREVDHASRLDEVGRALVGDQAQVVRASALGASLATLAADLTVVGVLALAILRVRGSALDGVNLAVVALLSLAAFEAVAALPAAWQGLGAIRASAARLFDLLDAAPAVADPPPSVVPRSPARTGDEGSPGPSAPFLPADPSREDPQRARDDGTALLQRARDDGTALLQRARDDGTAHPQSVIPRSPARTGDEGSPGPSASAGPDPLVEVRALTFTYPGATRAALERFDLRVDAGRRIAVVGASGSGKSTLAHLLLRFWDVPAGTIRVEGGDVTALPGDAVRARFAFASQRAHLFTGTLRENLRLARPDASDADLDAVLAAVRLQDLVRRLPDGLETWVGEQGLQLSGGERQRLALARALLRPAPVLLLDEPTAHLDPITEAEVLGEIVNAGEARGTLLITHRLVGLDPFDEVVVLARGRVVERGHPRALAAAGGPFTHLLGLQRAAGVLGDEAAEHTVRP